MINIYMVMLKIKIFAKDVKQVLNYVEKEMHRKDSFTKQTYINKRKKQIKLKSSKKLN